MSLPSFEGPLDLLLHLCQKHELDILDIPIAFVTEKYLEYLAVMQYLDLDVASEYLVMAATLAHIKSKMLLPAAPPGQEDESLAEEADPREALIRRLLEYQKYKQAALELAGRGAAANDVFGRGMPMEAAVHTGEPPLAQVPLFSLVEAFQSVLAKSKVKLSHDIVHERITLTDRINELVDLLRVHKRLAFDDLFEGLATKFDLIITFLAILEMTKLRMTKLFQPDLNGPIYVEFSAQVEETEVTQGGQDEPPPEAEADGEEPALAKDMAPEESGAGVEDEDEDEDEVEVEVEVEDEDEVEVEAKLHADLHAALYSEEAAAEVRDLFRIGEPGEDEDAEPEVVDAQTSTTETAGADAPPFDAEEESAIAEEPSKTEESAAADASPGMEEDLSAERPAAEAPPIPASETQATASEENAPEAAKESEAPVDSLADNASMVPQGTESDEDPK